jgi:hypothetical protein
VWIKCGYRDRATGNWCGEVIARVSRVPTGGYMISLPRSQAKPEEHPKGTGLPLGALDRHYDALTGPAPVIYCHRHGVPGLDTPPYGGWRWDFGCIG